MAKNDASLGSVGEFLKRCQQSGEPSTIDVSRDRSQTRTCLILLTNGYYTTRLWIGTPPQMCALIVDYGSRVTYVPCSDFEACGLFCNCVLSTGLNETKVWQVRSDGGTYGDKKKSRSHLSNCAPGYGSRSSRQKHCLPPSSLLIHSTSTPALTVKL